MGMLNGMKDLGFDISRDKPIIKCKVFEDNKQDQDVKAMNTLM